MKIKKQLLFLHRWLGFITGPLVFVIALTGAIYAFQHEIQDLIYDYRFISEESERDKMLPPSKIAKISDSVLPGKHLHSVLYYKEERSAEAIYFSFEEEYYYTVFLNPYSGKVLEVKDEYSSFFGFILDGHFYLWLSPEIGQPLVASVTLVFFFIVLSGLILWWPKKKKKKADKFKIKWNSRWRRKNYDLHTVLGMYISLIALIFIITGLVMGFQWFKHSYYSVFSGGEEYVDYYEPKSQKPFEERKDALIAIDEVWRIMNEKYPEAHWIEVHPAEERDGSIAANANPTPETHYDVDYHYFDVNSLEELEVKHPWRESASLSFGEKLMRANYDIHVGAILGFPGKLLAFLISLVIASLPVTGFLVWYGRKYKKKTNRKRSNQIHVD